jgi:hypothetical protein
VIVGDRQKYVKMSTAAPIGEYKSPIWSTSEACGSTDVQLYRCRRVQENIARERMVAVVFQ